MEPNPKRRLPLGRCTVSKSKCPPINEPNGVSAGAKNSTAAEFEAAKPTREIRQKPFDVEDVGEMEIADRPSQIMKECPACKQRIAKEHFQSHIIWCLKNFSFGADVRTNSPDNVSAPNDSSSCCVICKKNLSLLGLDQKQQHINRCLDESEATKRRTQPSAVDRSKEESRTLILDCPFCGRFCESAEGRASHIKRCAKIKKISTEKVIEAVKLQEKQAKERRDAGLAPIRPPPPARLRRGQSTLIVEPQTALQADIQIAKAISLSLKEVEDRKSEDDMQAISNESESQDQGLGGSGNSVGSKAAGRRGKQKTRQKDDRVPLLLLRSAADRERILNERMENVLSANVPAEPDELMDPLLPFIIPWKKITDHLNEIRGPFKGSSSYLWTLTALPEELTADKSNFYVPSLKSMISPSKVVAGTKHKHLSQVPGYRMTLSPKALEFPSRDKNADDEDDDVQLPSTLVALQDLLKENPFTQRPSSQEPFLNESKENEHLLVVNFCSGDGFFTQQEQVERETKRPTFSQDMLAMVANSALSDCEIIVKDGSYIPCHRFILFSRCQKAYKELVENPFSDGVLRWPTISRNIAMVFLKYLYAGEIEKGYPDRELVKLAARYDIKDMIPEYGVRLADWNEPAVGLDGGEQTKPAAFAKNDSFTEFHGSEGGNGGRELHGFEGDFKKRVDSPPQTLSLSSTDVENPPESPIIASCQSRTPTPKQGLEGEPHSHQQKANFTEPERSDDCSKVRSPLTETKSRYKSLTTSSIFSPVLFSDRADETPSAAVFHDENPSSTDLPRAHSNTKTSDSYSVVFPNKTTKYTKGCPKNSTSTPVPVKCDGRDTERREHGRRFSVSPVKQCDETRREARIPGRVKIRETLDSSLADSHKVDETGRSPLAIDDSEFLSRPRMGAPEVVEETPMSVASPVLARTCRSEITSNPTHFNKILSAEKNGLSSSSQEVREGSQWWAAVDFTKIDGPPPSGDDDSVIFEGMVITGPHEAKQNTSSDELGDEKPLTCLPALGSSTPVFYTGTKDRNDKKRKQLSSGSVQTPEGKTVKKPKLRLDSTKSPSQKIPGEMKNEGPGTSSKKGVPNSPARSNASLLEVNFGQAAALLTQNNTWDNFNESYLIDCDFSLLSNNPVTPSTKEVPQAVGQTQFQTILSSAPSQAFQSNKNQELPAPENQSPEFDDLELLKKDILGDSFTDSQSSGKDANKMECVATKPSRPTKKTSKAKNSKGVPHYSIMETPLIRKELSKIGVRALPKKKGVQLLKHVYAETHQESDDGQSSDEGQPKSTQSSTVSSHTSESVAKISSQKSSTGSASQRVRKPKQQKEGKRKDAERISHPDEEEEDSEGEDAPTELKQKFKDFLKNNRDPRLQTLQYQQLDIQRVHSSMKASGIRHTLPQLKNYLDDECVTYTDSTSKGKIRRSKKKTRGRPTSR